MLPEEVAREVPCCVATIHRNAGKNGFPKLYYVCGQFRLRRSEWNAYKASPPRVVIRKKGEKGPMGQKDEQPAQHFRRRRQRQDPLPLHKRLPANFQALHVVDGAFAQLAIRAAIPAARKNDVTLQYAKSRQPFEMPSNSSSPPPTPST